VDRFLLPTAFLAQTCARGPPRQRLATSGRDGQITPADAAITLQIAVGGSASCDPAMLAAADVSGDNRVTSLDALMTLQAAVGMIEL